ncbi:hypothetical protein [Altererythrobacter aquiaggeris]|uniref:hypothetical protein n=1 Tax=Aestuarierythrobacter aquiaggeris TaxID=1898396 RepID=UPI0030162587
MKKHFPTARNHAAILCLLIAGCGPADNESGPGGVSVGEAKALDDAAEMIEARRPQPGLLTRDKTAPEKDSAAEEPSVMRPAD